MTAIELRTALLWSAAFNYLALIIWFAAFVFAHDFMYRVHARWFKLSVETFDALHYGGMAMYKVLIVCFNLVPLAVLLIMGR